MNICNADAKKGAIANAPGKTKIFVLGVDTDSVMWLRDERAGSGKRPHAAGRVLRRQPDHDAVGVVGDWIKSIPTCP